MHQHRIANASAHLLAQRLRRLVISFALLVYALSLAGCAGASTPETSIPLIESASAPTAQPNEPAKPATIALVMKTLTNPFFVEMEKGARRAEKKLGIQLIVKTAAQETSIEQQIEIIEELIPAKVDAIIIAPGDSVGLIPVLKKAQDAGIVIINIDNRLDPELSKKLGLVNVPFISVDNEQGAYLSVKFISERITAPTNAIILEGIQSAQNAQDRKNGALRAFRENPNVTVVAMQTAHWKIDEAYDVTRALFTHNPNIGAVFCANDMMAFGALKYLAETGRTHVLVAGFDALEEAKPYIRTGALAVTIDQQAAEQGYQGVQAAVRALAGEKLPAETMVDVRVVSIDDLQ
jgi:ribose transport system substrate-binding protein